jgi:hypothetical protein
MKVIDVRPSRVFQGLDLYFQIGASGRLHAFLDVGVLEQKFRSGLSKAAWVAAYRDHAVTIDALIARKYAANPGRPVIVSTADFEPDVASRAVPASQQLV